MGPASSQTVCRDGSRPPGWDKPRLVAYAGPGPGSYAPRATGIRGDFATAGCVAPRVEEGPLNLIRVPLSLSLLITSPLRTDLCLSPVAAFIVPLVESNVLLGSLVIIGLDILVNFLLKLHLVCPPLIRPAEQAERITLTMPQLTQLIMAYSAGRPIDRFVNRETEGFGPLGGDEPLFPENLSVGLMVTSPFFNHDGSPDTSFNVPLFEIPGMQGALLIALLIITGRFIIEEGGLANSPNGNGQSGAAAILQHLMSQKGSGR